MKDFPDAFDAADATKERGQTCRAVAIPRKANLVRCLQAIAAQRIAPCPLLVLLGHALLLLPFGKKNSLPFDGNTPLLLAVF